MTGIENPYLFANVAVKQLVLTKLYESSGSFFRKLYIVYVVITNYRTNCSLDISEIVN